MNAAVGCARSAGKDRNCFGRQPVNPFGGLYGLSTRGICPEPSPVTFFFDVLVWNGTFYNKYKRIQLAFLRHIPELHEVVAVLVCENGIVKVNFRQPRDCAQNHVFDTWLSCCCNRDRVSIAA